MANSPLTKIKGLCLFILRYLTKAELKPTLIKHKEKKMPCKKKKKTPKKGK